MGVSAKRRARMKSPGKESVYARKLRGDYPPNSPYRTGDWGRPMRKLGTPPAPREEARPCQ